MNCSTKTSAIFQSVLRFTRFSNRHSVEAEANGCRPLMPCSVTSCNSGSSRRLSWSLRSSYPIAMAKIRCASSVLILWVILAGWRGSPMQLTIASMKPMRLSTSRRSAAPASDVRCPPSKSAWIIFRLRLENRSGWKLHSVMSMAFLSEQGTRCKSLYYRK